MTDDQTGQAPPSPPVADTAADAGDPRGLLILAAPPAGGGAHPHHQVEVIVVSASGGVLLLGWIDDTARPLEAITVAGPGWRVVFDAASLERSVRGDVAEALQRDAGYRYGYMGFVFGDLAIEAEGDCEVTVALAGGGAMSATLACRRFDDETLRTTLLEHLVAPAGVPVAVHGALSPGLRDQIVRFNRRLTSRMVANPYVERFGGPPRAYRGSIVVCLYGRAEFHFVQNALFSAGEGIEDYEFIFVCNSPELNDTLLDGARRARRIYGLDQTLVLLPGNAGFGAANNAAAQCAVSDRLLIVNPDVMPRDAAWARRHGEILGSRPARETRLFGAALYYDDGSLMHGGMYFEPDRRVWTDRGRLESAELIHVGHFGKGAPADDAAFTRPRPVPAVTGAFMSLDRSWFEALGGFSEDYVLGHYEDADLCLRSLQAGTPAWMQDLRLWHLEGKSSPRRPVHEGATLLNQWLFAARWAAVLKNGLMGREPTHRLLKAPTA